MSSTSTVGEEIQEFFQQRLQNQPARPQVQPIVGVDECLNHPLVAEQMSKLHAETVVQYVTGCWWEELESGDGSKVLGSSFPVPGRRLGRRVQGTSWPDEQVMWQLIAQFQCGDGLYFLSANKLKDRAGIRTLLEKGVRPLLNGWHRDRYWLAVLWKRPKTPVGHYARLVADYIRSHVRSYGYSACQF